MLTSCKSLIEDLSQDDEHPASTEASRVDTEITPPVEFSDLSSPPREHRSKRVISFLPNWIKNELLAMIAEFVGTTMFLLFAFGATNVANAPAASTGATSVTATGANTTQLVYISLAFGFSLTVNALGLPLQSSLPSTRC